ncbi:type VI secretion system lipoprotein TssJ [Janthinobacterium sp. 17J80-10]|uniref:type VI secretion system lipoprotein TssJ n=1 Tax=Janthinobacterium sp. 17J80-10 TaxID=2497863 RepID=UPI0013E8C6B5|nr:type VI secretion system lipoprotein TssJ [Janthinobacterium sp. 17J80-10]
MLWLLASCALFTGCSTAVKVAADALAEKALVAMGVKKDDPNAPRPPKNIQLRLETSRDLNAGEDGQGLSTVFRVYKLRDRNAFLATPYTAFGNPEREKSAFGQDLLEVREMILSPGEIRELKEKVPSESPYLGAVALYRQPSAQRWRFVFSTTDSEKNGITLGLHACAMTATTTPPVGMTLNESALLSTARCKS